MKIWLLRVICVLSVLSSYFLIITSHSDYGLVILFLVLCGAILPLTELKINQGILKIRQFHVYGFIIRSWEFSSTDKLKLQPFDLVISDSGPARTDDWYDVFFIFIPVAEITVSKFMLKYQKVSGEEGKIKLKLNPKEIGLIKTNLSVEHDCA